MAEQQEADAVQVEHEEDDEDDTNKVAYKPPEPKSMKEILEADKGDESLVKYKQSLLGCGADDGGAKGEKKVILKEMVMEFPGKEHEEMRFDLTDLEKLKGKKVQVKEGTAYRLKVIFEVQGDIVCGLMMINKVSKTNLPVGETTKYMVGSYAPKAENYTYTTPDKTPLEFPSGMIMRGDYKVKSTFIDDDKVVYCKWEWTFKLGKDWKD